MYLFGSDLNFSARRFKNQFEMSPALVAAVALLACAARAEHRKQKQFPLYDYSPYEGVCEDYSYVRASLRRLGLLFCCAFRRLIDSFAGKPLLVLIPLMASKSS